MSSRKRREDVQKNELKRFLIIISSGVALIIAIVSWLLYSQYQHQKFEKARKKAQEILERSYDSYDDRCNDSAECSTCKREKECLKCMHGCYNKYGALENEKNKYLERAAVCNQLCWEQEYDLVPKIDFGIPAKRQ
ncbi:hypothetical protein N9W34_05120 [Rickettsiales bacterium]|nr:hypothetical protein [Rickettsiales bacterium]